MSLFSDGLLWMPVDAAEPRRTRGVFCYVLTTRLPSSNLAWTQISWLVWGWSLPAFPYWETSTSMPQIWNPSRLGISLPPQQPWTYLRSLRAGVRPGFHLGKERWKKDGKYYEWSFSIFWTTCLPKACLISNGWRNSWDGPSQRPKGSEIFPGIFSVVRQAFPLCTFLNSEMTLGEIAPT